MKNLDCIQIEIFINLQIIGEEDKNKKKIIYIFKNLKNFLQFGEATWHNHGFQAQLFFFI